MTLRQPTASEIILQSAADLARKIKSRELSAVEVAQAHLDRIAEIERTAREGLLMPPKSTFFTPKLKTGFVIRSLRS